MEHIRSPKGSEQKELAAEGGGSRDQAMKGAWGCSDGKDLSLKGFQQDVVITYKIGNKHLL